MTADAYNRAAEYRYFTTDLLTNEVLAEISFSNVSYERAIRKGGSFQGTIPAIAKTSGMDLYESTMPGKTGLYVVRNGQCVWGGIVWTRSYNASDYSLQVSAVEFTKYLEHRMIWKTWTHDLSASAAIAGGVATVTLQPGLVYAPGFEAGSSVRLFFGQLNPTNTIKASGFYTVKSSPAPTTTTFAVDVPLLAGVTVEDPNVTAYVRADTYEYARTLVEAVLADLNVVSFPNDEIEPGTEFDVDVTAYSATASKATLTTATPHGIIIGQAINVSGVADASFNGTKTVTAAPTLTTLEFDRSGVAVASTPTTPATIALSTKALQLTYVTMTTAVAHGLLQGQVVTIAGAGGVTADVPGNTTAQATLDGTYVVDSVPSPTSFRYVIDCDVSLTLPPTAAGGTTAATKARIVYDSYGPFLANTDIGIEFSSDEYSGKQVANTNFRGFELRSLGAELEKYSNQIDGFEYRIDCEYDATTKSFKRVFVLRPINVLDTLTPEQLSSADPIRAVADELVFQWPGNITDLSMDETAEGTATRMWVKGDIGDLGADASQPYSAYSAFDLLDAGWPLLEEVESLNDVGDEETLGQYAQVFLDESRPPQSDIKISVNGSVAPEVGTYYPGDWCSLVIDDDFILLRLASDLEPRDEVLVRKIEKIKVSVPDSPTFPEKVELDLVVEGAVDRVGS